MIDILSTVAFIMGVLALSSVFFDLAIYEQRQSKWENAHPGEKYYRNYRKLVKQ
ncbi:hypothetical protein [Mycobacterium phage WXIN]|nr:hypothetical protein [Mycobacterium phage WXIN]